jgi:hypothetical protein
VSVAVPLLLLPLPLLPPPPRFACSVLSLCRDNPSAMYNSVMLL